MTIHKHLFFTVLVFVTLLISSCFTMPGKINFDPGLPPEQTTVVVFEKEIHVKEYNGVDVFDEWQPDMKYRKNTVTLPAGQAAIAFDLFAYFKTGSYSSITIKQEDIELHFNFEAGKTYRMGFYREIAGGLGSFIMSRYKFGIAIWDNSIEYTTSKNNAIRYWELGET